MTLPPYYFRLRENGAAVFAVEAETRLGRLEMKQIAVVNARNGEVKPQGGRELSDADRAAIDAWLADRQGTLAAREAETGWRLVEEIGQTAQWMQSKASADDIEAVGDALLMAMHDLRSVIVKKKADARPGADRQEPAT